MEIGLFIADWENETDNAGSWFMFVSESGKYDEAEKEFLKCYKQEYGFKFSGAGLEITEVDNVDGYKIKLVKI